MEKGKEKKSVKKTNGRMGEPKSLQIRKDMKLLKSNGESVRSRVRELNVEMARRGVAWTKAALEAALRERLGLVWMRRIRKRAA